MTSIEELVKLGKTNLDDANYINALIFFEKALTLAKDNADLWNLKGVALRSLGRYEEASVCYKKSLELEPRDKVSS
tara:strand:+ start:1061 stop:1288 length:228 start_codon:yes stop_codon:yes gene_type:complete